MIPNFEENRKYIENEFENAEFDPSSGMPADKLEDMLKRVLLDKNALPVSLLRARAFEYILDNAQIQINPHTIFADKMSIGVDYSGFASVEMLERQFLWERKNRMLPELLGEKYKHMKLGMEIGVGYAWTDFWHNVPDWNNILKLGFFGILEKAKTYKQKLLSSGKYDQNQIIFYNSVIITFEAIIRFMKRLYNASLAYDIPEYSRCILNLTKGAPQNLYEVMELSVLYVYVHEMGSERARTLGSVDRLYYPYFKNDIESGRYTVEEVKELFRYFFMHFTAAKRFAQEPLTICGSDEKGNCYANELTELMLDVYDELNIFDPKIHIRYSKSMPDSILYKALDMIRRGNSSICILNDDVIIKGYEKIGIKKEDAVNYVVLGCYEPIIMGKEEAQIGASWTNIAKAIEFSITGGMDITTGIQYSGVKTPNDFDTYDSFYEAFLLQLDDMVGFILQHILDQDKYSLDINPSTIYSATFTKCLENGRDLRDGYPLEYNNISIKCFGLATLVDSLMMIKKYVFEKKEVTFAEMKDAIMNNWNGYEELRNKIMKDEEKYGNNMERPDKIMCDVVEHLHELLGRTPTGRNGVFRLGMDSITNNILYGKGLSATPDGRLAYEPVSKNLCASNGMDRKGITGLINSLLKFDHSDFINSTILDFFIHPTAIAGEKGLQSFAALLKAYFSHGGGAVQGNIIDAKELREAKNNPEKYANLQIRVCGWNEYFVKLSNDAQEMFIKQTESQ